MALLEDMDRIIAACNTGPMISAFQCAGVELLKRYVARLYVTPGELTELERHGWTEQVNELVRESLVVVASELSGVEREQAGSLARRIAAHQLSGNPNPANHLPEGEMLVIALRPELHCRIVLLDEKAARAVAMEIGLQVTGFPGILARAGADGLVTKADIHRLLKSCQQQGTHYSDALIAHVAGVYGRRCEMSENSVHEPGAQWLTPQDVDHDVRVLSEALLEQRAERIARNVLLRPDIQEVMRQLLATRLYSSEEDIIVRSLKAMQVAIAP